MGSSMAAKKNKLPPVDAPLLIVTILLVVIGLVMMYSASFAYAYYNFNDSYHYIKSQLVFALIGFGVMTVASHVNYRRLHRYAIWLYLLTVGLLFVTLFMPSRNGAHRWIFIGSFQFQPSEIAKFAVILLFAHLVSVGYDKMGKLWYGYLQFLLLLGGVVGIMIFQPHVSGTILMVLIGVVVMFAGGVKFRRFVITAVLGGGGLMVFLLLSNRMEYAMDRIRSWRDLSLDPYGASYQTRQSLVAIGSGGLFGRGLGNSVQKYMYVPEPQNDFIFSIICEELGFVGAVLIVLVFVFFVYRGIRIALMAKDKFGALIAIGITAQIGLQAMLNIAVVTNSIPNTGISLPFFSYGGTSLVILLAEVGVLLSISRYSKVEKD